MTIREFLRPTKGKVILALVLSMLAILSTLSLCAVAGSSVSGAHWSWYCSRPIYLVLDAVQLLYIPSLSVAFIIPAPLTELAMLIASLLESYVLASFLYWLVERRSFRSSLPRN